MVIKVKKHVIFEKVYDKMLVNIWFILLLFFCWWTFICFSLKINPDVKCWKCFGSCLDRNQRRNVKEFWLSVIRICLWWIIVLFKCPWNEKLDDIISRLCFWVVQVFYIHITILMLISQTYQKYYNIKMIIITIQSRFTIKCSKNAAYITFYYFELTCRRGRCWVWVLNLNKEENIIFKFRLICCCCQLTLCYFQKQVLYLDSYGTISNFIYLFFLLILVLFLKCTLGYSMLFYYNNADKKQYVIFSKTTHIHTW